MKRFLLAIGWASAVVLVLALAPCLGGCGPVWATHLVVTADTALHNAQTVGAKEKAPYEYTAAEQYLHQARVKWGTSDFEYSVDYAKKARELAGMAREKAMGKDEE